MKEYRICHREHGSEHDGWECERFSGEYHSAEPDGFCAWGKRKEES